MRYFSGDRAMAAGAIVPVAGESTPGPPRAGPRTRLESLDLLRGVAIVFMALDHVRDFFSGALHSPSDLDHASPALFFTRWVTHFCAPVFVFLAGTGVYLSSRRGKTRPELARFLVTRGVWVVLFGVTLPAVGVWL